MTLDSSTTRVTVDFREAPTDRYLVTSLANNGSCTDLEVLLLFYAIRH